MSEESYVESETSSYEEPSSLPYEGSTESGHPQVNFMGNTYDLLAVSGVVTSLILMFICLTCNMGFYCLPFIPLGLGLLGLLTAQDAVDAKRTQTLSWVNIGIAGAILLIGVICMVLYIGLMVFIAAEGGFEN